MTAIPAGWVEATLGELGRWLSGGTPRKGDPVYWEGGTLPWVSPKDMKGDFIQDAEDRITERAVAEGLAPLVPSGSMLVVTRSGILAHSIPVATTAVESSINQDLKALVPFTGVNAAFVADQLRLRTPELLAHAAKVGTTVESLVFERLKTFTVRLAPPGEQARIADRLASMRTRTEAGRREAERLTGAVARIREKLADRMAQGRLSTSGRSASVSESHQLGELLTEPGRTGLSIRGRLDPPGVRALRLGALRGPVVDMSEVRYLPISEERGRPLELRPGDVLMARGSGSKGLVGRASLVRRVGEPTIFPDTAFRVRLDTSRIVPAWFVAVWNSPATRRGFEQRIRTTAGIWKIGWRDLRETEILLPSLEEQRDALEAFQAAGARLDLALSKRDRAVRLLERFEHSMAVRAFDGLLVGRVDGDVNAAELLSAIRSEPTTPVGRRPRRKNLADQKGQLSQRVSDEAKGGRRFDRVRSAVPAPYDALRDTVFAALAQGALRQRFDPELGALLLESDA